MIFKMQMLTKQTITVTNKELAIQVAQDFNREVLRGQLNVGGTTLNDLAQRIEDVLDTARDEAYSAGQRNIEEAYNR
jgi:hypothetical protein